MNIITLIIGAVIVILFFTIAFPQSQEWSQNILKLGKENNPINKDPKYNYAVPQVYNIPLESLKRAFSIPTESEECIQPAASFSDFFTTYSVELYNVKGNKIKILDPNSQTVGDVKDFPPGQLCVIETPDGQIIDVETMTITKFEKRSLKDKFSVLTNVKNFKDIPTDIIEKNPLVYYKKVDGIQKKCLVIGKTENFNSLPVCNQPSVEASLDNFISSVKSCLDQEENNIRCAATVNLGENTTLYIENTPEGVNITTYDGEETYSDFFSGVYFDYESKGLRPTIRSVVTTEAFPDEEPGYIDVYFYVRAIEIQGTNPSKISINSKLISGELRESLFFVKEENFGFYSALYDGTQRHFFKPNTVTRLTVMPESDIKDVKTG